MPSASKSSPCAASRNSSSPRPADVRAKSLGLGHDHKINEPPARTIAPVHTLKGERASRSGTFDSANFRAARRLMQEREESGLTLEEAAVVAKVSSTTIWRRENNLVDLGPLKQLGALEEARGVKASKGNK